MLVVFYSISLFYFNFKGFSIKFALENLAILLCLVFILFIIKFILEKNQLTKNNSYTLLIFVFLLALYDLSLHNNPLIITTLTLLFSFRKIYSLRKITNTDTKLYDAGFWIGISVLLNYWSVIYLLLVYFAIIIYKIGNFRRIFIPILGVLTPIFIYFTYCFVFGNIDTFYNLFEFNKLLFSFEFINKIEILIPSILFTVLLIVSVFTGYLRNSSAIKRDKDAWHLITLHLFLSILLIVFMQNKNSSEILFLMFPASIIITKFLQDLKSIFLKNIILYLFLSISILVYFLKFFSKT